MSYKQAFEAESRKTGAQQIVIAELKEELAKYGDVVEAARAYVARWHNVEHSTLRELNEALEEKLA